MQFLLVNTTKGESKVCSKYSLLGLTPHEWLELYRLLELRFLLLPGGDIYEYYACFVRIIKLSDILTS